MAEAIAGVGYIAVAAACMSRGLTPEQSQRVWDRLKSKALPDNVRDTQEWLALAIAAEERDDLA